jgi:hypothetical protein
MFLQSQRARYRAVSTGPIQRLQLVLRKSQGQYSLSLFDRTHRGRGQVAAGARLCRRSGHCVLLHDGRAGLPTARQLPIELHGLPSCGWIRPGGTSPVAAPHSGALFGIPRRPGLYSQGPWGGAIAAVRRGHGRAAQLDDEKSQRSPRAARFCGLFRGGGPKVAASSTGQGQGPESTTAPGCSRETAPTLVESWLRFLPSPPQFRY